MKINFYLDKPKREMSTIKMSVSLKGRGFFYISESVNVKMWDSQSMRLKKAKGTTNERINNRLDDYEVMAKKHYNRLLDDRKQPTYVDIISYLDREINGLEAKTAFLDVVQQFIDNQKKLRNTDGKTGTVVTSWIQTKRILEAFQVKTGCKFSFDSFDDRFYADFVEYLTYKQYSINNAGKHIKNLKRFLKECDKLGLLPNKGYLDFKRMEADVDVIALDEKELDKILNLKLDDKGLETQRDLFLVGCFTGLRYSDFGTLKKESFKDGYIHKEQKKTKELVIIPVHPKLKPILEKYGYDLPLVYENQTVNGYLKIIGKQAEIEESVEWREFKMSGTVSHVSPKHELITTHTARRSFCTNLFKAGFPVPNIMRISGHKTERDFYRYIRLKPMESAELLSEFWNK